MADSIPELIKALSEKGSMMDELLKLLEEEHRLIVKLDTANLETQMGKTRELFVRLESSANLSRQLMKQLAAELGLPEAAGLSPLLPKVALPHRKTLMELQRKLLETGAALDQLMAFNRELLYGALRTVNRSLEFFGHLFSRSTTYGKAGQMLGAAPHARIICKEI